MINIVDKLLLNFEGGFGKKVGSSIYFKEYFFIIGKNIFNINNIISILGKYYINIIRIYNRNTKSKIMILIGSLKKFIMKFTYHIILYGMLTGVQKRM